MVYFKNHSQLSLDLHSRIQCFVGKNGCGKTNILDAIHYLCLARSYFTKNDKILQLNENSGFRVDGTFVSDNETNKISCIYREDGKKEIFCDGIVVKKVSELIGKNSCVMIAPDDIALINEGSENRRRWLDSIFCQIDNIYLQHLQQYQKIIVQRNALLKTMAEKGEKQNTVMDFYNQSLTTAATYIYEFRKANWAILTTTLAEKYEWIAGKKDAINQVYESQLEHQRLNELLAANMHKDLITQRTNYGIHKDDIVFTMQNNPLKNIASQGQKKSFLLALKLAELSFLASQKGTYPILLLDDIFERLDNDRIHNLFDYISNTLTSQVCITDTNGERIEAALKAFTPQYNLYHIKD